MYHNIPDPYVRIIYPLLVVYRYHRAQVPGTWYVRVLGAAVGGYQDIGGCACDLLQISIDDDGVLVSVSPTTIACND